MNSPLTFFKGLFSRFFCSNSQATELQKEGKVDLNLLLRLKKETLLPIRLFIYLKFLCVIYYVFTLAIFKFMSSRSISV
jgi:hypothetical protein